MSERDDKILNFYVEDAGIELSQEEVNSLLPYFIKFVETGKLI